MNYSKKNKIDEFITLKLVNNKTEIYILGEKFIQCKKALINVNSDFKNIIDEVVDESRQNEFLYKITPEEEFWVHSSNIQAWVESNYDISILHSNIAFPLLKKLSESGNKLAKRKIAEEIAKKLDFNYIPTILYLIEEGYLVFLPEEYRNDILKKIGCKILQQKTEIDRYDFYDGIYNVFKKIMDGKLDEILFTDLKFNDISQIYIYEYNDLTNKSNTVLWYIVKYLLDIPNNFDISNRLDEFMSIFNIAIKSNAEEIIVNVEEIILKLGLFNNQQFNDEFIQPIFSKIINDELLYSQFKRKYNTEKNIYLKTFLTNSLLKYVDVDRGQNDLAKSINELIKPLIKKIINFNKPELRRALELSEEVDFLNRLIRIIKNGNENNLIPSLEKIKEKLIKRKIKKFTCTSKTY